MTASENTLAPLRRQERQRRITALRQRLHDTLGPNDCSVWLYSCGEAFGYGPLVRGDWDGFSDIDLLVVAANQDAAERAADHLMEALLGDDVLAIEQERWQAMAISPSPHWRGRRPRRCSAAVNCEALGSKPDAPGAVGGQVVTGGGTESMGRHRHPYRPMQPLSCQVITGIPRCSGPCPIWCVSSCP